MKLHSFLVGSVVNLVQEMAMVIFSLCGGSVSVYKSKGVWGSFTCPAACWQCTLSAKPGDGVWEDAVYVWGGGGVLLAVLVLLLPNPR